MNFKLLFFLKSPFSNQWSNICFVKFLHPLIIQFTFFWQISIHALKIIPQSQVLVNFWPYLFIPFDIIYECIHRSWWKYGTELLNFLNVMCLVSNHIFSHQGAMKVCNGVYVNVIWFWNISDNLSSSTFHFLTGDHPYITSAKGLGGWVVWGLDNGQLCWHLALYLFWHTLWEKTYQKH